MKLLTLIFIVFVLTFAPQANAQDKWQIADEATLRLKPTTFSQLPENIVSFIQKRSCTVPQTFGNSTPHNVIRGQFARSGHIFFADRFYGFDDATYAGARVLEILSNTDKSLSELLADLPETFSTPELRVDCADERKFAIVEKIAEEFSQTNKVITIDGARILFENGWGLVRASNTQAILVLRFEADTEENLRAIQEKVEARVTEMIS